MSDNNKTDEIVQQLIRYKNGVAADSMTEKGLTYALNYGVSVTDIMAVAKQYAYNNELAKQLFQRPEREAKLAAIYITNPNQLTDIDKLEGYFFNSEMVEQLVLRLIYKHPSALTHAFSWCQQTDKPYFQKAGWLAVGRASTLPNVSEEQLKPFIDLINKADFSSVHVRTAITYALLKIAEKSGELLSMVKAWLKASEKHEDANYTSMAVEIKTFLTS